MALTPRWVKLCSRARKREVAPEPTPEPVAATSHEEEVLPAGSVGSALLVVLDNWPAGPGGVQSDQAVPDTTAATRREVVAAFLAAARKGDFDKLLRLLDLDVAIRTDRVAVEMAAQRSSAGAPALSEEMRGVGAVALVFAGGAKAARLTLIDGLAGAVVSVGGRPMAVFGFTVRDGRVVVIELIADPETLAILELAPVRD